MCGRYPRVVSTGVVVLLALLTRVSASAQTSVTTWHNDTARTGQNLTETTLTPANVNTNQFGKLFSVTLDGYSYSQPLYLPNLTIGGTVHNVVFATTEHDTVYAFDADSNGGANSLPLWKASMLTTAHGAATGATAVTDQTLSADIVPEYGITGTPVIDPATGTLYVVSFTQEAGIYIQRLHALDVTSGAEKFGGPVVISGSVAGTGNGSVGGVLKFDPKWSNQRPALLLMNGIVYIGYSSHGDNGPWHGWIMGYNASTLAQTGVYCTSPNGFGSGIWMSGAGLAGEINDPAGHPFGRLFYSTGNGDSNVTPPYTNQMSYGEALVAADLTNGQPTITDQFTTRLFASLNGQDGDVGSGGLMLLPDQTGSVPHLLVQTGKTGTMFIANRDNLGGYSPNSDNVQQQIINQIKGAWSTPAYWNGWLYYLSSQDYLKSFSVVNGVVSATPTATAAELYGYPGATPSISANGTTNGIVWTMRTDGYVSSSPSVLQAHDATNVATLLYSSDQNAARDVAPNAVKFQVPTVANGKVYVAGQSLLSVYGLFNGVSTVATPVISPLSETFSGPISVTITDSTPGATIYYTTDGTQPTEASLQYTVPISVSTTQTIKAIAGATGYVDSSTASATYKYSGQADAPTVAPPGGSYLNGQTVTLSNQTAGGAMYYTLDGTTPTASSTPYSGPITISNSMTLKAITIASGFLNSPVATAAYVIQQSGTATNFSAGFSQAAASMTFNGSAQLDDSRLQLTNGLMVLQGSAFYNTKLPVTAFTTDFGFQLSNPQADGMTFTIQNNAPTALGNAGGGLGYQGIGNSVAIKFDLYSNNGEGGNSTGLYMNGAVPTLPATNLTPFGVDLHSGHNMAVHITYDGATLSFSLTDTVTAASYSTSWTINLPQIVGGNTAYFGFTGGTGGLTASQKVLTWTYLSTSATAPPLANSPTMVPPGGTFAGSQSVSLTDSTPGVTMYYTTDGTPPSTSATKYTGPFVITSTQTISAIATAPNYSTSPVSYAGFTILPAQTPPPAYGTGFTSASSMTLNGGATVSGNVLHLTTNGTNQSRSAFYSTPVPVIGFTTDFTFQLTQPQADGFAFVIQNQGPTAVGPTGPGLGFGPTSAGGTGGITKGVAVKFDLYNNRGEGSNSTGVYTSGTLLTTPCKDLTNTGIDLHSGHVFAAHLVGDGASITVQITDRTTGTSFVQSFPVNIAAAVGGSTAYVGFTGSTGGFSAIQNILTWTYTPANAANYSIGFTSTGLTLNGSATIAGGALQLINGQTTAAASAFTTAAVSIQSFTSDFAFQMPVANADGFTFTIQGAGPQALGPPGQALGFSGGPGQAGIAKSIALKFDLYDNAGEGVNSTGLYTTGALPTTPAINLTPSGVNLHSGDKFQAHITYDGANLALTLTDTVTNAVYTGTFPINLAQVVGGPTAFVGFTAGSGGQSATINILNWTFNPTSFPSASNAFTALGVTLNGGATVSNGMLQLTDGGTGEARSAFTTTRTSISSFMSTFDFQLTNPVAEGFTFVIQNQAPTALGTNGSGLGYGRNAIATAPVITPSVALKFDLFNDAGEGAQSTGLYTNGAIPTLPATALTGIDLHSGHLFHAAVSYDGANITLTITDAATSASYTQSFPVNLTSALGSTTAYLGFTGSTGASGATQNILNWTISTGTMVNYSSGFANATGLTLNYDAQFVGSLLRLTNGGGSQSSSAFTAQKFPVQQFNTTFNFQLTNAQADGFAFVIQSASPSIVGGYGGGLGLSGITPSVGIKFDLYNNAGETGNSTGIYLNGATPTLPSTDITPSGVNLHSGNVMTAQLSYDGTTLSMTLTDTVTGKVFTTSFPVNIPGIVGNTAYVGFTAGTGGLSATQDIVNWTYSGIAH